MSDGNRFRSKEQVSTPALQKNKSRSAASERQTRKASWDQVADSFVSAPLSILPLLPKGLIVACFREPTAGTVGGFFTTFTMRSNAVPSKGPIAIRLKEFTATEKDHQTPPNGRTETVAGSNDQPPRRHRVIGWNVVGNSRCLRLPLLRDIKLSHRDQMSMHSNNLIFVVPNELYDRLSAMTSKTQTYMHVAHGSETAVRPPNRFVTDIWQ